MPAACEKLITVFAVEPESITSWSDFRYVFEKFGFSQGRLVVKLPESDWINRVLTSCGSDSEKKQIEAALIAGRYSLFIGPPALGGAHGSNWLQVARNVHLRRTLDGLVVRDDVPTLMQFTKTAKIADCSEEFFGSAGQTVVHRDAKSLASAARELLELSSRVAIVDQYFSSKNQFIRSLAEFLRVASESGCEFIEVLTKINNCDRDDLRVIGRERAGIFKACRAPISLVVKILDPKSKSVDFHHRLILSEIGGIRYDAGFDDVDTQEENDVSVLNRSFHSKQVARYLGALDDFEVIAEEEFMWTIEDCRRAKYENPRTRRG